MMSPNQGTSRFFHLPRTGCTHLNQLLLGWWVGRQIYDEERIIGAMPRFTVTAPGWMRYPLKIDGQRLWKQWGLRGMNYFKIARSGRHNWSERFNPASKLYQAWLGVYIVRDSERPERSAAESKGALSEVERRPIFCQAPILIPGAGDFGK